MPKKVVNQNVVGTPVITWNADACVDSMESVLADTRLIGQDKSFVAKVLFGQVPMHVKSTIGEHVFEHNGIFTSDTESNSKVLQALRSAPKSTFYRLSAYLYGRLMFGRQDLSKTNLVISRILLTMEAHGIRRWETLTVILSDRSEFKVNPLHVDPMHKHQEDCWKSSVEFTAAIGESKHAGVTSVKQAPVFKDKEILDL